jgi:cyanophycin synthetase
MNQHDIRILDQVFLRGPNRWSYRPALEALVDIGTLEEFPSNTLPGFVPRLVEWLPGLRKHECSYEEPGGFVRRLEEGTWVGHILEHVTLELQTQAGRPAGFGRARSTATTGIYHVVVRTTQEDLTRTCLLRARDLILAAIEGKPFDVTQTLRELRVLADRKGFGPSTACIVDAAVNAKIPVVPLSQGNLVILGHGTRQRRIWTAETDRTSAIAESIASDKDLAKQLIAPCGIPVPEGHLVRNADAAVDAAEDLGYPVAIKPGEASRGEAVFLDLNDADAVRAAFAVANEVDSTVIVEKYIEGEEHRLLVVGDKVVAATRAEMFRVTGNGRDTLQQLLNVALNQLADASEPTAVPLTIEDFEDFPTVRLALSRQGLSFEAVPATGQVVELPRHAKIGVDVLAEVHPSIVAQATLAARVVGLDIAGVDIVARDISQPLAAQGGALIEINAGPALPTHLPRGPNGSHHAGEAIVRHLFPGDDHGRIPLIGIGGSSDTTAVARLVGFLLHLHGVSVGVACGNGLYLGERRVEHNDAANWAAGQRLLVNRTLNAAVIETTAESLLREGLPYDRCQVAVVTSLAKDDKLARFGVEDSEQLTKLLRTHVDVVLAQGVSVLNADDAGVLALAEFSDGEVLLYSRDAHSPAVRAALAAGRRAVYRDEDELVFAHGANAERLPIPPTFDAPECLPAAACAWAANVPVGLIVSGIVGFPAATTAADEATRSTN